MKDLNLKPYYVKLFEIPNAALPVFKDNKIMMNAAALADQQPPSQTYVNIPVTVTDKEKQNHSRNRFLRCGARLRPYVFDIIIAVVSITLIVCLELGVIPETRVGFYCKDPKFSFLYRGDTISATVLLTSCFLIPLLTIIGVEWLQRDSLKNVKGREVWFFYKEFLVGVSLVLLLTEVIKAVLGEHRPQFFDICEPDSAVSCTAGQYVEKFNCTNKRLSNYLIADSSRSFPSGHASCSFFVGVFSSYIIQVKLPTVRTGSLFKPFLIAMLLSYSGSVSVSRITDGRHHWWDVLAGGVLGCLGAIHSISILRYRLRERRQMTATSTTTLLDIKAKEVTL